MFNIQNLDVTLIGQNTIAKVTGLVPEMDYCKSQLEISTTTFKQLDNVLQRQKLFVVCRIATVYAPDLVWKFSLQILQDFAM